MGKLMVSLIIPVYNTGAFLERCLLSAINQTYKNLEIVVLNNGSTDNSDEIIRRYAAQDSRIKYYFINHVPTGCESRNTAIIKSSNEWIIPLDSDDYIESDYVDKMLRRQKETNADYVGGVMVGTNIETGETEFSIPSESFNFGQLLKGRNAASLTIGTWHINANGALMNKSLLPCIQRGNAKPLYNDEYETREILFSAKLVAFSKALYYYSLNPNSTGKKKSFSKLIYGPTTHLGLIRFVKEKYGVNTIEYKKEQLILTSILCRSLIENFSYNRILSTSEKKKYRKLIDEVFKEYSIEITNYKSIAAAFIYILNKVIFR